MGFLDELERQATAQRSVDSGLSREVVERNTRLANVACGIALEYCRRLADNLNVLRPQGQGRYQFDNRHVVERPPCANFGAEPKRRVVQGGEEHYESVTLQWVAQSGQALSIEKSLPVEIERLQARLAQAGIMAETSTVRHPETGRAQGTRFDFKGDVVVSVQFVALHAEGKVRVRLANFEALERVEVDFPAFGIRPGLLDELAKWIVGKPHDFLKYSQNLKRYER